MNRKKVAIVLCLAVLIGVFAIKGTVAYLQDSQSEKNVFVVGKIKVGLTEPSWDEEDEAEKRYPGDVKAKDPTITALEGDIYFRVKIELLENGTDKPVSPKAAFMIWKTIYFDKGGEFPEGSTTVKLADIKLPRCNPSFVEAPENNDEVAVKYFTYGAAGKSAVLEENADVVLFTTIIIPADYGNHEFAEMGDYDIKITVEAIQAANILPEDAEGALNAAFPAE